ncbi:MAG: cell division protein FtsL [Rhodobacteraceae bacterium]|nr:cell division protein FtsL [Paracoccaceae bacterium]
MRPLLYVLSAVAVMGLAFWAYRQNYATQDSLKEVARLQREIGALHEALGMQQAEWAYENRPARLRELTLLNFDKLNLLPMTPEQFGAVGEVAMPQPVAASAPMQITQPVETAATLKPKPKPAQKGTTP